MSDLTLIHKQLEKLEASLAAADAKREAELKNAGSVSAETKAMIEKFGETQRELADRLLLLEQKGAAAPADQPKIETWGSQFIKADAYKAFVAGQNSKVSVEVKSTVTGTGVTGTVQADRQAIVGGAFLPMVMESLIPALPTTSNAVDFVRESGFTNNAAEAAEGAAKAETDLTVELVTANVRTIAHWIKISRQLAADAPALAAYINSRMVYGVNLRVENQLITGNGTAPNLSGLLTSGNYTAHGYLSGALGSTLAKLVLIRKVIGDMQAAGYRPSVLILNPVDWATIEIELMTTAAGQALRNVNEAGQTTILGLPVASTPAMTSDRFLVSDIQMACTVYNREGVQLAMSESDSDNFQKNLITVRAERRLAFAVERPAATRGGDITPAAS